MSRRTKALLVGLAGFCLLFQFGSANGFGQSDHTRISGFVRDASGGVIPGAKVILRSEGEGFTRGAASNDAGYYVVSSLPPGLYSVTAEFSGFKRHLTGHKKLDPGIPATLDIVLQIGDLNQTISVEAAASSIQSDSATVGGLIEGKQVQQLQLNGRNPVFLALIKPGVSGPLLSGFSFGLTDGSMSINGSRSRENLITFDGAVGVRTRSGGASIGVADVDAVQEVQVLTANYGAEYGRSSGGQIRIVTRSGTRDFHGSFYEYIRNASLDANSWLRRLMPDHIVSRRKSGRAYRRSNERKPGLDASTGLRGGLLP